MIQVTPSRSAVVTGAARGIGAAIAVALARDRVFDHCLDILGEPLAQTVHVMGQQGWAVQAHVVDLSLPDAVLVLARKLVEISPTIDVLVNNATMPDGTPLAGLGLETFHKVMAVNVDAIPLLVQHLLPALRKSASGRILNIASVQGFRGTFDPTAYGTSKGAIVNLTRSLACDLAPNGMLVNALAPGFIDTPMAKVPSGGTEYDTEWFQNIYIKHRSIPLGRPGLPDDVASAAAFFCSQNCCYLTGQIIAIDGGLTATF